MVLAVYRENWKITRIHEIKDIDWNKIGKLVEDYNNKDYKDKVEISEIQEGTLLEYLYKRAEVNVRDFIERLKDIECRVDNLSTDIRNLLSEAERQRLEDGKSGVD